MAFMNFFKNEEDDNDVKDNDDKPIGGFSNWKEALESMKEDQINKHRESIKKSLEKIIKDNNLDFELNSLNEIINEKATYIEENKELLEEKYENKDYESLIYKFSEEILKGKLN